MPAVMYLAFPPVDVHNVHILYISLLCTISLVLLYKNKTTYYLFTPLFLSIPYLHFRLKDVYSME